MSSGNLKNGDTVIAVDDWSALTADALRKRLLGATVVDVQADCDDTIEFGLTPWPVIFVRSSVGELLALNIGHDEEGNGGGFIHIGEAEVVGP